MRAQFDSNVQISSVSRQLRSLPPPQTSCPIYGAVISSISTSFVLLLVSRAWQHSAPIRIVQGLREGQVVHCINPRFFCIFINVALKKTLRERSKICNMLFSGERPRVAASRSCHRFRIRGSTNCTRRRLPRGTHQPVIVYAVHFQNESSCLARFFSPIRLIHTSFQFELFRIVITCTKCSSGHLF